MHSEDTVGPGGVSVQGMRSNNAIHLTLSKEKTALSRLHFQCINPLNPGTLIT